MESNRADPWNRIPNFRRTRANSLPPPFPPAPPTDKEPPRARGEKPHHALDEHRLPRPAPPDDDGVLPPGDGQIQPVQDDLPPESFRKPTDFDHRSFPLLPSPPAGRPYRGAPSRSEEHT